MSEAASETANAHAAQRVQPPQSRSTVSPKAPAPTATLAVASAYSPTSAASG